MSALALASNLVFHAHTKDIKVDYHFIREKVVNHDILVKFIKSPDNVADIFTKGLSSMQFFFLKSKLMVVPHISLQGAVKIHGANEDTTTIQDHEGLANLASIDDEERTNT
jgi:hypothetical protein